MNLSNLIESFNKIFNGNIFIYQDSIWKKDDTFFFLTKKVKKNTWLLKVVLNI